MSHRYLASHELAKIINILMRANEFITEQELDEVDRRGFLKALGAGAAAAATAGIADRKSTRLNSSHT